jgi:hypothetical protein
MPAEPPACVQNAMMTKDKKPFTYTPGGIDLSQIKSPRMAKRVARNARSEGVANQPKPSPLAQDNNNNNSYSDSRYTAPSPVPSSASMMGATAMGMPFQVFPTSPSSNGNYSPSINNNNITNNNNNYVPAPPPPPPPPPMLPPKPQPVAPSSEQKPSVDRKPIDFEPPPFGCRPEIKIPPNPMAALKSAPKPRPKDDFWIEEYRREKAADEPPKYTAAPPRRGRKNHFAGDKKKQDAVFRRFLGIIQKASLAMCYII